MRKRIIHNRIQCHCCGDIIESISVHDYVECSCGKAAVDGGKEYLRRCFDQDICFIELSEIEET